MTKRALEIEARFDQQNVAWDSQITMAGLVGDIGDLSKLVTAKNGFRKIDNVDDKIAHELADCLWSLLILADKLDVDLGKQFMKTMDELEAKFDSYA